MEYTHAIDRLAIKLAVHELTDDPHLIRFAVGHGTGPCSMAKTPGVKDSWIENVGGRLPNYICNVAKDIHEKRGKTVSQSIQIAIGVIKKWARGGGDVNPDTRAKAAKAVAEWEALKARAKAKK